MKKKPELLSPLNGWKTLHPKTTLLEHADAVYFGLKTNFSMRARAENFSPDDLKKLMTHLHNKNVRGYLTTNILIYNIELHELYQVIELAYHSEVDAVICHDPAAILICKDIGMPFHVSTQANISNKISAKFYEALGAERIIAARELDLDEIKEIVEALTIPVEVFVHGAMCTAISGRCYLSSELMGFDREYSANRGKCVQPCRRVYTFMGEEGNILRYEPISGMFFNAKDLSMIAHVPELIETGVGAFKIEGRMRDPLYIETTTRIYREAIEAYYKNEYTQEKVDKWYKELRKVFNRGFHTGFYFGKPTTQDIQFKIRGNASTLTKQWIGKVINYYKKAQAIEIELYEGSLQLEDSLIIENPTGFFTHFQIKEMRIDNVPISKTPSASRKNHVIVGIKVEGRIPINANVFVLRKREI